ncbi:hypothetical protein PsorP6_015390 [Peronosclerospora sorghi]|uniref:Uncharacterized protein n=1 Tax=Peronosclerospora sorghi TaxID=230839 RepID=A0ACC0WQT5_9STRA|nr:hypothetical protein PsorP6_015390 [Peronosclerospora sorghi]
MLSSSDSSSSLVGYRARESLPDATNVSEDSSSEVASKLSFILQALELAGFPKARMTAYTAFDRVLSGITWLIEQIVRREDAESGRVQWNVLFQSHDTMKPRLGLAQEVVRCLEALPSGCPVAIQPHECLLQEYGDIEAMKRVVLWLIEESREARHLEKIRRERAYLKVRRRRTRFETKQGEPLTKEMDVLIETYAPKRRWRYVGGSDQDEESEDALIQRCLLEYGEKMATIAVEEDHDVSVSVAPNEEKNNVDVMAEIATQAAALAVSGVSKTRKESRKGLRRTKRNDQYAIGFERQYQEVKKQAQQAQHVVANERRTREAKWLQQVVVVPEEEQSTMKRRVESKDLHVLSLKEKVKKHEQVVQELIKEKNDLDMKKNESHARASALNEALAAVQVEMQTVQDQMPNDAVAQTHVVLLRQLLEKKDELKQEKSALQRTCRLELRTLEEKIENLQREMALESNHHDVQCQEMEQLHAQMAQKYKEMQRTAARQTRAVHGLMKDMDAIPSRMEIVQYEKRLVELSDQVALTLEETRKYFCSYNTLKTLLQVYEKELSLMESIHDNFDAAVSCKTATQAFCQQMDSVLDNMHDAIAKQLKTRNESQSNIDALDSTYQVLLERERRYVTAIRDFQFECEKNEHLAAKLDERRRQET